MKDMLHLRRGERLNPAEFPQQRLARMHSVLDALADEQRRAVRRERAEAFASWVMGLLAGVALIVLVGLWIAEGSGWL